MLLQKSKFDAGDIVSLKLTSGEEIVGKYVSEDMMEIVLTKVVMLAMTQKGVGMAPYMVTIDPDKEYAINKQAVILKAHTDKDIADQYTYQTTGIQPVSAGSIIK